jgi:hypothetical protein
VAFVQSLVAPAAAVVPARFRWQVCNDADTYCAPGRSEVTLVLPGPDGRAPGAWPVATGLTVEVARPGLALDGARAGAATLVVGYDERPGQPITVELVAGARPVGRPVVRADLDLVDLRPGGPRAVDSGLRWIVQPVEGDGWSSLVVRVTRGREVSLVVLPGP